MVYNNLPVLLEKYMKYIIVGLLFLVIFVLFRGLFTLVKDKGQTKRTVNALTLRVGLSIALIAFILISYKAGLIKPNKSPFTYTNKTIDSTDNNNK